MARSELQDFVRKLGQLIISIHKKTRSLKLEFFTEDITFSQFFLLELLAYEHSLKMTDIAAEMNSSLPAATALADKMVRSGLIQRTRNDRDRRVVNITLTARGKRLIDEMLRRREKMISKVFGKLTVKERDTYLHILGRIDKLMEPANDEK